MFRNVFKRQSIRDGAKSEYSIWQSTNNGFLQNIYFVQIFQKMICVQEFQKTKKKTC